MAADPTSEAPLPLEATAPGTGTTDRAETELSPEEEPVTTGTLFLTTVMLMFSIAVWVVLYRLLLER